jgi:ubiquinone/menaquinone biosynthesis C-methylase UbiE
MERLAERGFHPWRERLWSLVNGSKVLEVGVGTGRNMPYDPNGQPVTAIDLTPGMMEQAIKRSAALNIDVDLRLGDVQVLEFPDASFDTAVAAFVFCSVPNPILGLSELARVVKPGGQVLLLEHMRSANPIVGVLMDLLNPLIVRIMGANINRRTMENVEKAGLIIKRVENLGMVGMFKLIVAHTAKYSTADMT